MTDTTLLQMCHEYRDVAYYLYNFCTQSVAMQLLSEQSHVVISFVPFAPAECIMCQFIFKLLFSQTLNILFEICCFVLLLNRQL